MDLYDEGLTADQYDNLMLSSGTASTVSNSNGYLSAGSYEASAPNVSIILTTDNPGDGFSLNNPNGDDPSNYYIARLDTAPDDLHINTSASGTVSIGASTASLLIDGATGKVTAAAALAANGTLYVAGAATFAQMVQVVGALSASQISVANGVTAASMTISGTVTGGPATFSGQLNVTGQDGYGRGIQALVSGASSNNLIVGQALTSGSSAVFGWSPNQLYLNLYGGGALTLNMAGVLGVASAALTGALTAASASLTGALTAASATLSGALKAGSATLTGSLTAASASFSGAMNAGSASISSGLSAASASISGAMSAASANLSGALTAANATVSGLITTNNATVTGTLTVDGNVITGQQQIPTEIGYGPQQNPVNGVNYLSNQPTNYTTTDIYGNVTVPGSLVINSNPPYTSQSSNVTGVTAVTHVGGSLSNQLVLGVYDSSQNVKSGYVQYNNGTNSQGANSFPGVNIGVTGGTAQVSIDATGNLIVPSNVLCNNLVVGGQNLSNSFGTGINIIAAGKAQFTSIASNGQSTYLTLTVTHNLNLNSAQLLNASIQCTANSYNNWHVLCNVTNSTANSFNVVVIHMYIGATANDIQANSMSSSGYGSYIDWTLMVLNYCNGNFA